MSAAGYTGVWATENTREEIWDAIKCRETYATSGPHMVVRVLGGFDFTKAEVAVVFAGLTSGVGFTTGASTVSAEVGTALRACVTYPSSAFGLCGALRYQALVPDALEYLECVHPLWLRIGLRESILDRTSRWVTSIC